MKRVTLLAIMLVSFSVLQGCAVSTGFIRNVELKSDAKGNAPLKEIELWELHPRRAKRIVEWCAGDAVLFSPASEGLHHFS